MSALGWVLWAGTVACSVFALACSIAGRADTRFLGFGRHVTAVAAAVAVVGLVHRTVVAGHLPVFGSFENTYSASAFLLALGAVVSRSQWAGRNAWRLLTPWAIALLLWGVRYRTMPTPMTISEQSIWIDLHVLFAWSAHSVLLWGGSLGILRAFSKKRDERPEEEQQLLFLLVTIGYVLLTIMLAIGSWYLFLLFARFWKWEIVGATAVVVWLGYSLLIHGRLLHGLKGRAFDLCAAGMIVPTVALFWIWSVYSTTYHFFDIVLVKP